MAVGWLVPARVGAEQGCLGELGLDDPGAAMPVVLVHGFTGSPADFDAVADRLEAAPVAFAVYRFDYSAVNTRWVGDEAIGPKLRRWVLCLSDASSDGGGVGRVGIVAHSMGGLAARYALRDTGDGSIGDRVAVVTTLGTPHEGSMLAGPPNDGSAGSALARSLFDTYVPAPFGPTSNLDTPAARALAVGSPELAQLPDWPDGVAVWAGAGQFIAEQRFFFFHRDDPAGDLVVSEESATALAPEYDRLGGTDTSECRIPVPHDLTTVGVAAAIGYTLEYDPGLLDCYHGRLTRSDRLLVPLVAQLTAAANRPPRQVTQPTLGVAWLPDQRGWGEVEPATIDGGGSAGGQVDDIAWDSWGGEEATGTGTGYYVGPGQFGYQASPRTATIVASDLGDCHGQLAYRRVHWYFASEGETPDSGGAEWDPEVICGGTAGGDGPVVDIEPNGE